MLADVGGECWVCGPTAAALHGFDGFALRRPYHVLLPRTRNVRRAGVAVHTTGVMPPIDRESRGGIPVTSPTRTLIDIAGQRDAGPTDRRARWRAARRSHQRGAAAPTHRGPAHQGPPWHSEPHRRPRRSRGHAWGPQLAGARVPAPARDRRAAAPRARRRCLPEPATGSSVSTATSPARGGGRAARLPVPPDPAADGARRRAAQRPRARGREPYQFTYTQVVTQPDTSSHSAQRERQARPPDVGGQVLVKPS